MSRELDSLERQIERTGTAHERDMRVISEIGPEVHDLFVQLGCKDTHVPAVYSKSFMTDRNLMRMLGLIDQQTALLMSVFSQLDHAQLANGGIGMMGSIGTGAGGGGGSGGDGGDDLKGDKQKDVNRSREFQTAARLQKRHQALRARPAPPKMGDFDDDDDDDDDEDGGLDALDELDEEEDDSSSSSSDSDEDGDAAKRRKKKAGRNRKNRSQGKYRGGIGTRGVGRGRQSGGFGTGRGSALGGGRLGQGQVPLPESISSLRKNVQRKIESGDHRHHHSSVHRFEPKQKDKHFLKRTTVNVSRSAAEVSSIGISPEARAALQVQHMSKKG